MMIHRKLFNIKFILTCSLLFATGFSQPKLNIQLGSGFYSPSLVGLDPDSNNVLPKASFLSKNLLLNWGVRYQIYPNMRVGYTQSHSLHSGKIGSSKYSRNIAFRSISFETLFAIKINLQILAVSSIILLSAV